LEALTDEDVTFWSGAVAALLEEQAKER